MSEQPQDPPPQDAAPAPTPAPEPRRPRRLAVKSLIGLYALSLLAAGVLLLRPASKEAPKPKSIMKLPSGLLSSEKKEYVAVVEISGAIYEPPVVG
ncbi:MAG: hypothetical protein HYV15_03515 [Elusimicrobia bacterium]|nr:hypothetical protein [Elusimicrobiota bacterium]